MTVAMTSQAASNVVSAEEWTTARIALLEKEKEFVRLRDELSEQVRGLPWERVTKTYEFEGPDGNVGLEDLFGGRTQLLVYHFMFHPSWEEGCPSCSFIADGLAPAAIHLAARDVSLALISRAPLEKLLSFKERMGWPLTWVSSAGSDFNPDYQACTDDVTEAGEYYYNYQMMSVYPQGEQPGLSVFARGDAGQIYHTYSTYARGLEAFITTYRLLDIVPKGRDEVGLPSGMAWLRHHDRYEAEAEASECCHHE